MSNPEVLHLNVMNATYTVETEEPLDADRDYSVQPLLKRRAVVHLFCRDINGERRMVRDWRGTFKPYFYAPTKSTDKRKVVDFLGRNMRRVGTELPGDVPNKRALFDYTDEAAVLFERRFLIDKKIKCGMKVTMSRPAVIEPAPNLDIQPRLHFYDIETAAEGDINVKKAEYIVNLISAYDSYERGYNSFINRPPNIKKREVEVIMKQVATLWEKVFKVPANLRLCPNEFQTINMWTQDVHDTDPDILLAHNGDRFDFPYLFYRCANKHWKQIFKKLSPLGRAHMRGDFPYIQGREHIDFCGAKAKRDGLYTNFTVQDTDVDSLRLEELAEVELSYKYRFGKIGTEMYDLWYSDDPKDLFKMIWYGLEDVMVMVEVNRKKEMTNRYVGVQQIFGSSFRDTLSNTHFIDIGCLRESEVPLPTKMSGRKKGKGNEKVKKKKKQIEGGIVIRPEVGIFGEMKK